MSRADGNVHLPAGIKKGTGMSGIDWNRLWKDQYVDIERGENLEFWNNFAPRFRKEPKAGEKDEYIEQFYEFSEFRPGETIFDMGCASGSLAIPYAERGHEIYAADFSPEMLKYLMIGAEEHGVADKIHPIQLNWNEDWSKRDLPVCDVAISSRSFIVYDLTEGIKKLESVARRRVCIGAWDTPSPNYDRILAREVGYERPGYGCYVYVMNELMDRDLLPDLRFIKSRFRCTSFPNKEAAVLAFENSMNYGKEGGLTEEQHDKMLKYCDEHLMSFEKNGEEMWKLDHEELSTVAHISWNKELFSDL